MRPAIFAVLFLLAGLVAGPLFAQPAATPMTPAPPSTATATTSGPSQPVPVPVPTTRRCNITGAGNVLWVIQDAVGFAVPALLLFTGLSARMRDAARAVGRNW